jgi:hypothetical protein
MSNPDPLFELLQVALDSRLPPSVRHWFQALADGADAENAKGDQLAAAGSNQEGGGAR